MSTQTRSMMLSRMPSELAIGSHYVHFQMKCNRSVSAKQSKRTSKICISFHQFNRKMQESIMNYWNRMAVSSKAFNGPQMNMTSKRDWRQLRNKQMQTRSWKSMVCHLTRHRSKRMQNRITHSLAKVKFQLIFSSLQETLTKLQKTNEWNQDG